MRVVYKMNIRPAKAHQGNVLFHRVAVPFVGTFAVLPQRINSLGGIEGLTVAILGQRWDPAKLANFLATK